jgi:hypothetical protein
MLLFVSIYFAVDQTCFLLYKLGVPWLVGPVSIVGQDWGVIGWLKVQS